MLTQEQRDAMWYKIKVMQDYANGKKIQARAYGGGPWFDIEKPEWNWSHGEYRVAEETSNWHLVDKPDKGCDVYHFHHIVDGTEVIDMLATAPALGYVYEYEDGRRSSSFPRLSMTGEWEMPYKIVKVC